MWWRIGAFVGLGVIALLIGYFVYVNYIRTAGNCTNAGMSDFGDAPDGQPTGYSAAGAQIGAFPTSLSSNGATTEVDCGLRIGDHVSGEADYNDPADPDPVMRNPIPPGTNVPNQTSDYDDGIGWEWRPDPAAVGGLPAHFVVSVDIYAERPGEVVVNVLQDHNMDGDWSLDSTPTGGFEWPIWNHHVPVAAGHQTVQLPPVRFPVSFPTGMPDCFWMRVVVSDAEITADTEQGWAGTGAAGQGEDEYVLVNPTLGLSGAGVCTTPDAGRRL